MINRALFKQSCKANWVKWLSVTVATCAMLAIVIIVLGNLAINDIRDSLKDVFAQADEQSYLKENSVDFYELYLTSTEVSNETLSSTLVVFDQYEMAKQQYEQASGTKPEGEALTSIQNQVAIAFSSQFAPMLEGTEFTQAQLQMIVTDCLSSYESDKETAKISFQNTIKSILPQIIPNQIAQQAANKALEEGKSEEEIELIKSQTLAISTKAVNSYVSKNYSNVDQYSREDFVNDANHYVNSYMYDYIYNMQKSLGAEESVAIQNATAVKVIANTATTTYEFWLNEYKTQEGATEVTDEQKADAKQKACESISDQIPEKVAVALKELGNMDMYSLIIGSIFYKIAGLLLPMVFVIMTANSLIASQVDSGSMAYVLSTPTKRRTVAITQLAYLLLSLFAMFALLTIVSVISVWISGGNSFAINYGEILLLNAGAYLTMFAIAGFCFMCSAIFNRTKYSLSIGGGLTIFALVCTILGLFGSPVVPSAMRISQMNFFNYLSIITLFDVVSILGGTMSYLWKFAILLGIGIITIIIGIFRFDKKDLPL